MAGLAAAHRAAELARERGRPLDLVLLEAADRLGGTIRTEATGGFLVEGGPDSFLSDKPWALDLCRRLGRRVAPGPHRRPVPPHLRGVARPAAPAAGGLPAPRPDAAPAAARVAALLLAGEAPHGPRPAAAARGRCRREPRRLRAAPARPRGARARGPAAGRRDLHRRPRRALPRRDHAALPRAGAPRAKRDPRDVAGRASRPGVGHERGALVPVRDVRRRDGGADPPARANAFPRTPSASASA